MKETPKGIVYPTKASDAPITSWAPDMADSINEKVPFRMLTGSDYFTGDPFSTMAYADFGDNLFTKIPAVIARAQDSTTGVSVSHVTTTGFWYSPSQTVATTVAWIAIQVEAVE